MPGCLIQSDSVTSVRLRRELGAAWLGLVHAYVAVMCTMDVEMCRGTALLMVACRTTPVARKVGGSPQPSRARKLYRKSGWQLLARAVHNLQISQQKLKSRHGHVSKQTPSLRARRPPPLLDHARPPHPTPITAHHHLPHYTPSQTHSRARLCSCGASPPAVSISPAKTLRPPQAHLSSSDPCRVE